MILYCRQLEIVHGTTNSKTFITPLHVYRERPNDGRYYEITVQSNGVCEIWEYTDNGTVDFVFCASAFAIGPRERKGTPNIHII